ncbi:MAG: Bax inhibitor-1 family protein [Akkermansiaceae bacterium]|jgi:FtsH-binding integral membrane protein|nr:Bax inhibitor-1 family protein [Roseibacillus sp.]
MFDSYQNPYAVAAAPADVRATFIRKTYAHLAGAIAALVAIELILFSVPGLRDTALNLMLGGKYNWLFVIGGFMIASWLANKWAMSSTSLGMQYAGLGLYVFAQAVIFFPILIIAADERFLNQPAIIGQAAIITGFMFGGLTLVAFTTKKDFSFLSGILKIGGLVALGLIVASIFMGFNLGIWFSGAMVLIASVSILYNTSNIIHHYGTTQYVAASLGLFASVALLFFYVLRILMALSGRD